MKNRCIFVAISMMGICLLAGCNDPERSQVIGTWQLQKPEQISDRFANSDDVVADNNNEPPFESRMVIEFRRNGILRTVTRLGNIDREKQGTWVLKEFDSAGNRAVIRCEINSQTTEHELEWTETGQLKMVPPNMAGTTTRLTFVRSD